MVFDCFVCCRSFFFILREDGVRSWMWVVNHQQTSRDEMHVEYYGKHLAGHGCGQ